MYLLQPRIELVIAPNQFVDILKVHVPHSSVTTKSASSSDAFAIYNNVTPPDGLISLRFRLLYFIISRRSEEAQVCPCLQSLSLFSPPLLLVERRMEEKGQYAQNFKEYKRGYVVLICDKKHNVLFTDTECLILSPEFKIVDENLVLLRAPRKNDVYSLNLKDIIPSGGGAIWSEVYLLRHSNMIIYVWLVEMGFNNKASCKKLEERTVREPLDLLYMDLFGPVSIASLNRKKYCLVGSFEGKFEGKSEEGLFVGLIPLSHKVLEYTLESSSKSTRLSSCGFSYGSVDSEWKGPDWIV
ncbi:hypothetical protein Tco_0812397 [Tanacetum coccineum]